MSVLHLLSHPFDAVRRWPVEAQQQARRNAMVAATALAQRRAELEEVQEFLAGVGRPSAEPTVPAEAAHG
jgi:hypothetical protein